MRLSDKLRVWLPTAILLVAFGLRSANITSESLWRDEIDSVRFAFEPLEGILRNFAANGFNGPLYHLLLRAWLTLAGVNDFALRYFSLGCGVALVGLMYALTKRLFGQSAALLAMGLATVAPILIWYADEGKMYSLQPMLLTLAIYALVRAVDWQGTSNSDWEPARHSPLAARHSRLWWAVFIITTSLSFYTHLLSPIFLGVAVIFFFAMWPHARAHLKGGAVALGFLVLPYLPLAVWQLPTLIRGGDVGHAFYPLDLIARTLIANWTLGLDAHAPLLNLPVTDTTIELVRWLVIGLFCALALYGAFGSPQGAHASGRMALATLAWGIIPPLIVFAVSTRFPIFQPRYVLWCAPAFYILVGVGLARLTVARAALRWVPYALAALLALVSLSGVASHALNPIRPDLRGAATYVAQFARPGDAIVFQIPYGRHSYMYYAQQAVGTTETQIVEAPYTNYGMSEDEVASNLLTDLSRSTRVWLFETEAEMWDTRGLVRDWFDTTLIPIDRRDFRGVKVGLYRPR
jgi:uncharacterized membrane protein